MQGSSWQDSWPQCTRLLWSKLGTNLPLPHRKWRWKSTMDNWWLRNQIQCVRLEIGHIWGVYWGWNKRGMLPKNWCSQPTVVCGQFFDHLVTCRSKKAPRIFFFYLCFDFYTFFKYETIVHWVPTFFVHNKSILGRVRSTHPIIHTVISYCYFYVDMWQNNEFLKYYVIFIFFKQLPLPCLAVSVVYFKKKIRNRFREYLKIYNFFTYQITFLLTCQPHNSSL